MNLANGSCRVCNRVPMVPMLDPSEIRLPCLAFIHWQVGSQLVAILFLLVSSKNVPLLQKPPRSHTILRQSPVGSFQYWAWNLANQSSADPSVLLASPGEDLQGLLRHISAWEMNAQLARREDQVEPLLSLYTQPLLENSAEYGTHCRAHVLELH